MPLNERKIIEIILEECNSIEERCGGYKEEMFNVIVDIMQYEYAHRISRINIQKKITDKCNAAANFLVRQNSPSTRNEIIDP